MVYTKSALLSLKALIACVFVLLKYRRTDFEHVVKQFQMALYQPDCNSNDCELPSRQPTPSINSTFRRHERCIVLSLFTLAGLVPPIVHALMLLSLLGSLL